MAGVLDFLTSPEFGAGLMMAGEGLVATDEGRSANMAPYLQHSQQLAKKRKLGQLAEKITKDGVLGKVLAGSGMGAEGAGLLTEALKASPEAVLPLVLQSAFPKKGDPYSRYKVVGGRLVDLSGPNGPRVAVDAPPRTDNNPYSKYKVVGGRLVDMSDPNGPRIAVDAAPKAETDPLAKAKALAEAEGHKPGTPEYDAAVLRHGGKSGIRVTTDENGRPVVTIGGNGGDNGLGRSTTTNLEGRELDSRDTLARLDRITASLEENPDIINMGRYGEQLKAGGLELFEKFGGTLGPEDKKWLYDVTAARADIRENLNLTIKAITGAAMSNGEAERIRATVPDIYDSPTVFKAKLERSIEATRMAVARYNYWRHKGMETEHPADMETLSGMKRVMETRFNELEKAVKDGKMTPEAASAAFSKEFGV